MSATQALPSTLANDTQSLITNNNNNLQYDLHGPLPLSPNHTSAGGSLFHQPSSYRPPRPPTLSPGPSLGLLHACGSPSFALPSLHLPGAASSLTADSLLLAGKTNDSKTHEYDAASTGAYARQLFPSAGAETQSYPSTSTSHSHSNAAIGRMPNTLIETDLSQSPDSNYEKEPMQKESEHANDGNADEDIEEDEDEDNENDDETENGDAAGGRPLYVRGNFKSTPLASSCSSTTSVQAAKATGRNRKRSANGNGKSISPPASSAKGTVGSGDHTIINYGLTANHKAGRVQKEEKHRCLVDEWMQKKKDIWDRFLHNAFHYPELSHDTLSRYLPCPVAPPGKTQPYTPEQHKSYFISLQQSMLSEQKELDDFYTRKILAGPRKCGQLYSNNGRRKKAIIKGDQPPRKRQSTSTSNSSSTTGASSKSGVAGATTTTTVTEFRSTDRPQFVPVMVRASPDPEPPNRSSMVAPPSHLPSGPYVPRPPPQARSAQVPSGHNETHPSSLHLPSQATAASSYGRYNTVDVRSDPSSQRYTSNPPALYAPSSVWSTSRTSWNPNSAPQWNKAPSYTFQNSVPS
jgi:hypothetical protein